MATDKKASGDGTMTRDATDVAVAPGEQVEELRKRVEALQRELARLKDSGSPGKVQVEGIFTGTSVVPPPAPVQEVLTRYVALKRALFNPVPDWVFPGSTPAPPKPTDAAKR